MTTPSLSTLTDRIEVLEDAAVEAEQLWRACTCDETAAKCSHRIASDAADAALDAAREAARSHPDWTWTFTARDDGGVETTFEVRTWEEAEELAESWVRAGDYDTAAGPHHLVVHVWREDDADVSRRVTVTLDQDEPKCSDPDGHDWQAPWELVGGLEENPGVRSHGGGVISSECCMRCGCKRTTDTWAQNRETGEQGLHEVRYTEDYYTLPNADEDV